ncbi:DUF3349 domain-containing protein [Microlunatus antarcticus]|uniref:DUF3349 domain-containing protein n=1 Tax=Microlunatus antarcticus TaxID=53388 RepID=A0A7W5JWE0_9ACTN|nr:hypothetical protein [Microlunatus antarcticus]
MTTTESTDQPNIAVRVLNWLEAGYPEGVPPQDRFPLIALLQRRLTDDQTRQIVHDLTSSEAQQSRGEDEITQDEIEELIQRHLRESPSSDDVTRVSARLAAAGWPLADAPE